MDYNKLILSEEHFRSNGYDFKRNAKFTIIEIIEKQMYLTISSLIEKH